MTRSVPVFRRALLGAVLMFLVAAGSAAAGWSHDPFYNSDMIMYYYNQVATDMQSMSDGSGGVISTWHDSYRLHGLVAQHLDN